MYRQEGYDIGDAWYYVEGETAHLFCLLGTGGRSDIAHLVSRDLRTWENVGVALRRGAAGSWDDLRLATGSVIRHQGTLLDGLYRTFTLFSLARGDDPMVQRVGMALLSALATDLLPIPAASNAPTTSPPPSGPDPRRLPVAPSHRPP